jgi:hypothetical protein
VFSEPRQANNVIRAEPGGWIQWEEVQSTDNEIVKPAPDMQTPAMDKLVGMIMAYPGYDEYVAKPFLWLAG